MASQKDFERYTRVYYERFGDRVKNWITLNELWVVSIHVSSENLNDSDLWFPSETLSAPEIREAHNYRDFHKASTPRDEAVLTKTAPRATRQLNLGLLASLLSCHTRRRLYNKEFRLGQGERIGVSLNGDYIEPWDSTEPKDYEAAERRM
uniref:Beta-glucosidase n=1 Tax=Bionectria ochroleuca TaxID=29856 RepID=A0A0B7KMM1_BIOOC